MVEGRVVSPRALGSVPETDGYRYGRISPCRHPHATSKKVAPISNFIDLDRRFRELTDKEREEPSMLASVLHSEDVLGGDRWERLLQSQRVVILAEAGAGKTKEMEAQAARLKDDGEAAFFIPIEELDKLGLEVVLAADPTAERLFADWKAEPGRVGYFFIDAVDELKLTDGKLSTALTRLAAALGDTQERARVFVSCRPSDWRPVLDLETFRGKLPAGSPTVAEAEEDEGEDAFLAPFRKEADGSTATIAKDEAPRERCVLLMPLGKRQIETFASARGTVDVPRFMEELRRRDAWPFARRPLDLEGLLDVWEASGKLGSRREQHEADIGRGLKDHPDRRDQALLSHAQAVEGVERLALAMLLARTRTIRSPEHAMQQGSDQHALSAEEILDDWSPKQVQALLRRGIFDPATYGRVRFHHRSVQEFLAARRLVKLRELGMPEREVRKLLFAEKYGDEVLIPSMRPVAAWLACGDRHIASTILKREPETLILQGDPESLPDQTRNDLVRAYVNAYSGGGWRGLDMPIDELRRLAHPDLASVIRECWQQPHQNDEVWEFLLKLIWLGEIRACSDLAHGALLDSKRGDYARVLAGRALLETGDKKLLRAAADAMLSAKPVWPARLIQGVASQMYPDTLTSAEFEKLLRDTPEPKRTVGGFSWHLLQRVADLDPHARSTTSLRKGVQKLLWNGRKASDHWNSTSSYGYLAPALAKLASRQIMAGLTDKETIKAAVIASQFEDEMSSTRDELKALRAWLDERPELREAIFWAEIEIVQKLKPEKDPWNHVYRATERSLIGGPQPRDRQWLLKSLSKKKSASVRKVAFEGILWTGRVAELPELDSIRTLVAADADLSNTLNQRTAPRQEGPQEKRWREQDEKRKADEESKRAEVEKGWKDWFAELIADPDGAFAGKKKKEKTRWNLFRWVTFQRRDDDGSSRLARSGWGRVRRVVNDEIGDRFEAAMREVWRTRKPPLHSARKAGGHNTIFGTQGYALTGLLIEAASASDWATKLSKKEARAAAEWSTLELNGFPEWLPTLWDAYPAVVAAVFEKEITFELADPATREHTHVVNGLRYGAASLRERAAPLFLAKLKAWPPLPKDKKKQASYLKNLEDVLAILSADPASSNEVLRISAQRFAGSPGGAASGLWLKAVASIDLRRATNLVRAALAKLSGDKRRLTAVAWFGTLFGDRGFRGDAVSLEGDVDLLLDLTKLAYECIRREDDHHHDGVYSPDARDEAESARNRLLGAVIGKPGPEAHAALLTLAGEPLFAHMADRLRKYARERASADSDLAGMTEAEVRQWERTFAVPPRTRDELYRAMFDRLEDIEHDVLHHDFNDRSLLEAIKLEEEMQPVLARRFEDSAAKHYTVAREEVVAGRKETDIRLVVSQTLKAVTEIKIGDRYSVNELLDALESQLLGQYLRHSSCAAGCLLVTYAGRKSFEHPITGAPLAFAEVIDLLSARAAELEAASKGRVRLGVFGLDLTDPLKRGVAKKKGPTKAKGPRAGK